MDSSTEIISKEDFDAKEILRLMRERRSIRNFKDKDIEKDKLMMILEAARWSQSANNAQPWRLIVIRDKNTLQKLSEIACYGGFIKQAPCSIAIVGLKDVSPKWYLEDTTILSHQVCLMAWSLGIGTCWIGSMDRVKAGQILNLKPTEYLTTVLPIGYPKNKDQTSQRKPLREIVSQF